MQCFCKAGGGGTKREYIGEVFPQHQEGKKGKGTYVVVIKIALAIAFCI